MVPLSGGAAGRAEGERSPEHTKIANDHGTDRPRPVTAINKVMPSQRPRRHLHAVCAAAVTPDGW